MADKSKIHWLDWGDGIRPATGTDLIRCDLSGIPWVIVGGESGPGARPMSLQISKHIVDSAAGQAVFFKQMGSHWALKNGSDTAKGDDPTEWPSWARRREFPWDSKMI